MKKKPYPIVGMFSAYADETETSYYFSNELLEDAILIKEQSIVKNVNEVETMLTVLHINKTDALNIGVYWGPLLHGIQTHGILTSISNLHKELPLDKFLVAIKELSCHYSSASMQSDMENAKEMNTEILEEIHKVQLLRR